MTRPLIFVSIGFLLIASTTALWATGASGEGLYKKKCAACHGAMGEGKPAMKAPAIKGTTMSVQQIAEHLTKGEATSKPPHNKGISGLTEPEAKSVAEYIKTM